MIKKKIKKKGGEESEKGRIETENTNNESIENKESKD